MCHKLYCPRCFKAGWIGCGKHIDMALEGVPIEQRCACSGRPRTQAEYDASGGASFASFCVVS